MSSASPHGAGWKANLLLAAASAVFAFLLLEGAARVWLARFASEQQLSWYGTFEQIRRTKLVMYEPHHYLPYIPRRNYRHGANRHNSLGFRGEEIAIPKPPDTFRIACLGGSTTYTTFVGDFRRSYPYQLQEELRRRGFASVEVINAGVAGYASWESLINLEFRVLDLAPDVIVVYHAINDAHARFVYPPEAYRGDNSGSRTPYLGPQETFWDASAALRILRTRMGLRKPLGGLAFRRTYQYLETNFADELQRQRRRGAYPSGPFVAHSADEMLDRNPPVYFERNLRSMVALCRAHGCRPVFVTFVVFPDFPGQPETSFEYLRAIREHNDVVRRLARQEGVAVYDLAAEFPLERKYFIDGRHMNEDGARLKAQMIAAFLEREGLVPGKEEDPQ